MPKVSRSLAAAAVLAALAASPAAAQLVIDPTAVGHQLTNNGWTADLNNSPFWDNYSADRNANAANCNVGFFALGTIDPDCSNAIAGTYASEAGILANPYGYTTSGPDAFAFSGSAAYDVTLLGGLHGSPSNLYTYGCGSLFGGGCGVIDHLTQFNDSGVGYTYRLDYRSIGVDNWGFAYYNSFNPSLGCDYNAGLGGTGYCTGLNDGTSLPSPSTQPQFFALFESNNTCTWGHYCYLVGAEDNKLEYLQNNTAFHDGDYQDWLINVTATPEPATMALLATGLVGMAGAGLIRRRRGPAGPGSAK